MAPRSYKEVKCELCSKSMKVTNMKRHMKSCKTRIQITQEANSSKRIRPLELVCTWPACEKRFRDKYDLSRHMLSHNGERSVKCEKCGACIQRKDNHMNKCEHINFCNKH